MNIFIFWFRPFFVGCLLGKRTHERYFFTYHGIKVVILITISKCLLKGILSLFFNKRRGMHRLEKWEKLVRGKGVV